MAQTTPYSPVNVDPQRECKCGDDGCTKISRQYAEISVPIELKPNATVEDVSVECCGEPSVMCRENRCNNTCQITVGKKSASLCQYIIKWMYVWGIVILTVTAI